MPLGPQEGVGETQEEAWGTWKRWEGGNQGVSDATGLAFTGNVGGSMRPTGQG